MDATLPLVTFFTGVRIMSTNNNLFEQLEKIAKQSVFEQLETNLSLIAFPRDVSNGIGNGVTNDAPS